MHHKAILLPVLVVFFFTIIGCDNGGGHTAINPLITPSPLTLQSKQLHTEEMSVQALFSLKPASFLGKTITGLTIAPSTQAPDSLLFTPRIWVRNTAGANIGEIRPLLGDKAVFLSISAQEITATDILTVMADVDNRNAFDGNFNGKISLTLVNVSELINNQPATETLNQQSPLYEVRGSKLNLAITKSLTTSDQRGAPTTDMELISFTLSASNNFTDPVNNRISIKSISVNVSGSASASNFKLIRDFDNAVVSTSSLIHVGNTSGGMSPVTVVTFLVPAGQSILIDEGISQVFRVVADVSTSTFDQGLIIQISTGTPNTAGDVSWMDLSSQIPSSWMDQSQTSFQSSLSFVSAGGQAPLPLSHK